VARLWLPWRSAGLIGNGKQIPGSHQLDSQLTILLRPYPGSFKMAQPASQPQWQAALPESVKVFPASGTNFHP
jgi:hypothetical protein